MRNPSTIRRPRSRVSRHSGFTLIELLAVMAIIAILATMIAGVSRFARQAALKARARADIQKLRSALEEHKIAGGAYPLQLIEIQNQLPGGLDLTDPWERPYEYSFAPSINENTYSLYSEGPRADISEDNISGR